MSITVTSTSDKIEAAPATADAQSIQPNAENKESAPSENPQESETTEASDPSEEQGEESSATEGDGEEDQADVTEDRPKKKSGGFQKRIQKLTKRVSEFERERDYWREQAMRGVPPEQKQAQVATPKAESEQKPTPDKYETHEEFVEAISEWKAEQKIKAFKAEQREAELKSQHQRRVETLQAKVKDFAKQHDDFQELIDAVDTPMSAAVEEFFLMAAEDAPAVMYELAKSPETYERINRMGPLAAARELGKIEARLAKSASEKPEPKTTTKAPPPPTPISGKSDKAAKRSVYDVTDSTSQAEYERLRAGMR